MSERRFFVSPADLGDVESGAGASTWIRGPEHHHLSRVLRLREGDEVSVFDGEGRGFHGIVEEIAREDTRVRIVAPDARAVEPVFHLTLAQGIPHHDKMDLIIQKATELGVSAILPVVAERTVVRTEKSGEWKRLDRWRRVAREASRQSGRLRVPEVAEPASWAIVSDGAAPLRFILDQGSGASGLAGAFEVSGAGKAIVAVGPEGGWTDEEVSRAASQGFHRLGLGPRVLRTETAGIVAVTLLMYLAGELGPAPRLE